MRFRIEQSRIQAPPARPRQDRRQHIEAVSKAGSGFEHSTPLPRRLRAVPSDRHNKKEKAHAHAQQVPRHFCLKHSLGFGFWIFNASRLESRPPRLQFAVTKSNPNSKNDGTNGYRIELKASDGKARARSIRFGSVIGFLDCPLFLCFGPSLVRGLLFSFISPYAFLQSSNHHAPCHLGSNFHCPMSTASSNLDAQTWWCAHACS